MKISTFMAVTNPEKGRYPYLQAIESHLWFSGEFILVDGGSTDGSLEKIKAKFGDQVKVITVDWPQGLGNWNWEQFAKSWNAGYEACSGDWVIAGECDHIFEYSEAIKMVSAIQQHGHNRRVLFADKIVNSTWYRWHSKSKMAYALNKGQFKDMGYGMDLRPNLPQDLASPIIIKDRETEYGIPTGELLGAEHGWNLGVRFVNYDKTFQTAEMITINRKAANWAWNNSCLVKLGLVTPWEEEAVLEDVVKRMVSRFEKSPIEMKSLNQHPENMRDMLMTITPQMLGFDLFGNVPAQPMFTS